jgi:Zn finger protein HypA/HybF involved in hydrogenase expression
MSVALEICRIAALQAGPGGAASVTKVAVDVGDDAGVEVSSLAFCLETVLSAPPFAGATAAVTRLPGDVLRVAYLEVDDGRPDD